MRNDFCSLQFSPYFHLGLRLGTYFCCLFVDFIWNNVVKMYDYWSFMDIGSVRPVFDVDLVFFVSGCLNNGGVCMKLWSGRLSLHCRDRKKLRKLRNDKIKSHFSLFYKLLEPSSQNCHNFFKITSNANLWSCFITP